MAKTLENDGENHLRLRARTLGVRSLNPTDGTATSGAATATATATTATTTTYAR